MNECISMEELIKHQYELPRKLTHMYYAEQFPHVSFLQAVQLYQLAVEETLIMSNKKDLFSGELGFGRGLMIAQNKWLNKMQETEKFLNKGEKNE